MDTRDTIRVIGKERREHIHGNKRVREKNEKNRKLHDDLKSSERNGKSWIVENDSL